MSAMTCNLSLRSSKKPRGPLTPNQFFSLTIFALLAYSSPGVVRAECPPVVGRERLFIGFLPALTANKGQSKHFVGAFKFALCQINHHVLGSTPYYLDYIVHDTKANTTVALRGMTDQFQKGSIAFIGPEDNCAIEARLAAAWNLPMISFKCRDSSVSNRNGLYPTFIRTIPSTAKVSKSLISVMKHFGWKVFQAIVGDNSIWREAASTLRHRAEAAELIMNPDVHFKEPYVGTQVTQEIYACLDSTYQKTRIYVFLGDHHALMDFARHMHVRNLNNGEYLVISVAEAPYDPTQRFKYFHKYLEEFSEDMVEPFRSVIMLLPSTPSNPKYNEFLDESRRLSYLHPFYAPKPPFPELKLQVPIFAAYLYDAVSLYARVLKETLDANGDIRNGSDMVARLTQRTYESIQGNTMFIDPFGNAEANYTVISLQPDPEFSTGVKRRSLQSVGHFTTHGILIPTFTLTREIDWISGKIPVSEPECGFDGSKCNTQTDWPIAIICTVTTSVAVVAVVLVLSIRHYIYEQKLASLLWKIDYKDLLIVDNGSDSSFSDCVTFYARRSFGRLSLISTAVAGQPTCHFHTQVASYKGQTVAVKIIRSRHIEINRTVKKELHLMKEMQHDNINRFIGACIEIPHAVCIVTDYCQRGSLRDILENNDIHLDDMFIASLVYDLIKGMIYLHDSEIGSHGSLRPSHCLVDSRWVLQISSFGLHTLKARDGTPPVQDDAAIYKQLWRAPELLRDPCAPPWGSQKSDVYAFGLILYELHSRCRPWSRMKVSAAEILRQVKNPVRGHPLRPDTTSLRCGDFVKRCIQDCWQEDEALRPDFKNIRTRLKPMQQWMSTNIFDNMLAIMEKYATRLETLVEERTKLLAEEKKKTESLLLSMLPKSVAVQLIRGEQVIPEQYESVTIYFSDIVDFTRISAESTPMQVVDMLNDLYTLFDSIIGHYDVYKVETIGDAYMVVSGLPIRNHDLHAGEIASMSLHLLNAIKGFRIPHRPSEKLQLRIGIHSGPVVAGVVGLKMPRYCLFGDTVNTASRMESNGKDMKIHCSSDSKVLLDKLGGYVVEARGVTNLKGRGEMFTYFVIDEDKSQRLRRISQQGDKQIDTHSFTESALGSTHNTSVTESCISLESYKVSQENNNYRVAIADEPCSQSRKMSMDGATLPLLHEHRQLEDSMI